MSESPRPHRVLLCVSGSISAYKAADLVSTLVKAGIEVQCLLSESGEKFIPALVLETLSKKPVKRALFGPDVSGTEHIELARWADLLVFAPATANLLAKLSLGFTDDLITTVALASRAPWLIAPAMNTVMWEAPPTQEHVARLQARGVRFVMPAHGVLACGEIGAGKLASIEELFTQIQQQLELLRVGHTVPQTDLSREHLLITSGPTVSRIDAVRYITNPSTGRMGAAIAEEALNRGARVTVIQGVDKGAIFPVDSHQSGRLQVIKVTTAEEMAEAALSKLPQATGVIATAAVLDYRVASPVTNKQKRGSEPVSIELIPSVDVLQSLKNASEPQQWFLGFAAETDSVREYGKAKLIRKNLDWLFANRVAQAGEDLPSGFGSHQNEGTLFSRTGETVEIAYQSKRDIAKALFDILSPHLPSFDGKKRPSTNPLETHPHADPQVEI